MTAPSSSQARNDFAEGQAHSPAAQLGHHLELLEEARDLVRASSIAFNPLDTHEKNPAGVPPRWLPITEALCSFALELLLELSLQPEIQQSSLSSAAPLLPRDVPFRMKEALQRATPAAPQDLYTREDVASWLGEVERPFSEYLLCYRDSLSFWLQTPSLAEAKKVGAVLFEEPYLIPLYYVARERGWIRAIQYLQDLWAHGWIPDSLSYFFMYRTLALCRLEGTHPARLHTLHGFGQHLLTIDSRVEGPQARLDLLLLEADRLRADADDRLTRLRQGSPSYVSWIRGLHGLMTEVRLIANLLRLVSERLSQGAARTEAEKRYRYYEEIRCDMWCCLRDPLMFVASSLARPAASAPSEKAARRALHFFLQGRVFAPRVIIERFETMLPGSQEQQLPVEEREALLTQRFYRLLETSLSPGLRRAYELLLGPDQLGRRQQAQSRAERLKTGERFQQLGPWGQSAVALLNLIAETREMLRFEDSSPILVMSVGKDGAQSLKAVRNHKGFPISIRAVFSEVDPPSRTPLGLDAMAAHVIDIFRGLRHLTSHGLSCESLKDIQLLDGAHGGFALDLQGLRVVGIEPLVHESLRSIRKKPTVHDVVATMDRINAFMLSLLSPQFEAERPAIDGLRISLPPEYIQAVIDNPEEFDRIKAQRGQ